MDIRIFGMTATPSPDCYSVLQSDVFLCSESSTYLHAAVPPTEVCFFPATGEEQQDTLTALIEFLRHVFSSKAEGGVGMPAPASGFLKEIESPVTAAAYNLGMWPAVALSQALLDGQYVKEMGKQGEDVFRLRSSHWAVTNQLKMLQYELVKSLEENGDDATILETLCSKKVSMLVHVIREKRRLHSSDKTFRCMVFVERRNDAQALSQALSLEFACGWVVGNAGGGGNSRDLKAFKYGELQVLVTTDTCAEGIDVPGCGVVIAFDRVKDPRHLMQLRGRCRARNEGGSLVILVEQGDFHRQKELQSMLAKAELIRKNILPESVAAEPHGPYSLRFPQFVKYFESSGATLNLDNAVPLLYEALHGLGLPFTPHFKIMEVAEGQGQYVGTVSLPVSLRVPTAADGWDDGYPPCAFDRKREARACAAFRACLQLHAAGLLSDDLLPASPYARPDLQRCPGWDAELVQDTSPVTVPPPGMSLGLPSLTSSSSCLAWPLKFSPGFRSSPYHLCMLTSSALSEERKQALGCTLGSKPVHVEMSAEKLACLRAFHAALVASAVWEEEQREGALGVIPNYAPPGLEEQEVSYLLSPLRLGRIDFEEARRVQREVNDGVPGPWTGGLKLAIVRRSEKRARHVLLFQPEILELENVTVGDLLQKPYMRVSDIDHCIAHGMAPLADFTRKEQLVSPRYLRLAHGTGLLGHLDDDAKKEKVGPCLFLRRPATLFKRIRPLNEREAYDNFGELIDDEEEGSVSKSDNPAKISCQAPMAMVSPSRCHLSPINFAIYSIAVEAWPQIFKAERMMLAMSLIERAKLPADFPPEKIDVSMRRPDNDLLETIGDSWLQLYVNLHCYRSGLIHEGSMNALQENLVCNARLLKAAHSVDLHRYIHPSNALKSRPFQYWSPLLASPQISTSAKWKSVADAVEAVLGCALVEGGESAPIALMRWMGFPDLMLPPDGQPAGHPPLAKRIKLAKAEEPYSGANQVPLHWHKGVSWRVSLEHLRLELIPMDYKCNTLKRGVHASLKPLQDALGYTFNVPWLCLESVTNPSWTMLEREWGCMGGSTIPARDYQRLEFLGDAVLSYMATVQLDAHKSTYHADSAEALSVIRSLCVRNSTLAELAVGKDVGLCLHRHVRAAPQLAVDINRYAAAMRRGASPPETPKALADCVEALIGAVWIDSGFCMDTVSRIFWKYFDPIARLGVTTAIEANKRSSKLENLKRRQAYSLQEECDLDIWETGVDAATLSDKMKAAAEHLKQMMVQSYRRNSPGALGHVQFLEGVQ